MYIVSPDESVDILSVPHDVRLVVAPAAAPGASGVLPASGIRDALDLELRLDRGAITYARRGFAAWRARDGSRRVGALLHFDKVHNTLVHRSNDLVEQLPADRPVHHR